MTNEEFKDIGDAQYQATQANYDHLPTAFSVLTEQGKVRLTRHEGNVEAFEV